MPVFASYADLRLCFGRLYDEARNDARIASKLKQSNLIIQFRYDDPHAVVTINTAAPPAFVENYFDIVWDVVTLTPDVEMWMKADTAHQFWHGKVNLMAALTRRQIVARGPIAKILKLLPSIEPMYTMYPQILRELGRPELIVP